MMSSCWIQFLKSTLDRHGVAILDESFLPDRALVRDELWERLWRCLFPFAVNKQDFLVVMRELAIDLSGVGGSIGLPVGIMIKQTNNQFLAKTKSHKSPSFHPKDE